MPAATVMARTAAAAIVAFAVCPLPAHAEVEWKDREHTTEISFEGKYQDCGDDVEERVTVPYPARNVKVRSPRLHQSFKTKGGDLGSVTIKAVEVRQGADPLAHEVVLRAYGGACGFRGSWRSEDIKVRVEYEQRVDVPESFNGRCQERFVTVSRLRTQRTSCTYARSLVLRYLRTLSIRGTHRLAPWVCVDRAVPGGRDVACRGPGRRFAWFSLRPAEPGGP